MTLKEGKRMRITLLIRRFLLLNQSNDRSWIKVIKIRKKLNSLRGEVLDSYI